MSKIGTAHVEIKPVLNEEALEVIRERIEQTVASALRPASLPTSLRRSRRVLQHRPLPTEHVVRFARFAQEDDAFPVYLDVDSWIDMGKPDVITVDIFPGDLLNTP